MNGTLTCCCSKQQTSSSSLGTANTRLGEQPLAAASQPDQCGNLVANSKWKLLWRGSWTWTVSARTLWTKEQVEVRFRPTCQDAATGSEEGRDLNGFFQI